MNAKKPTALIILDGFGCRTEPANNAIALAKTPHITSWLLKYPHTQLKASGTAVGLLPGFIGNSEVGHLTIGAGRIITQPLTLIHNAIKDGSFFSNQMLNQHLTALQESDQSLHIMGLLSDAGVHSHVELLYASIKAAVAANIKNIIVHPFLDGRDVPPRSAQYYLQQLEDFLHQIGRGIIGSIHGRFYAMDRDHHWDRTQLSYQTLTEQQTSTSSTWQEILKKSYANGITALRQAQGDRKKESTTPSCMTDEFVIPTQLTPQAVIKNGDGIIFINFRPDRARQITQALIDPEFKYFPTDYRKPSFFITPVGYSKKLHTDVLFPQPLASHTLKDVLDEHEKSMLSIAETEKYAHVTYFFSGGRERVFHNEIRILIPSIPVPTYAPCPEMSAAQITQAVIKSLKKSPKDFYLINYANADMVGHSGNLPATIKAVECLDAELEKLYEIIVRTMDGTMYITADHGKAEEMVDSKTGQPKTSHTTNPVPFIMLRKNLEKKDINLPLTGLSDIAPWILEHMGLPVPDEMKK